MGGTGQAGAGEKEGVMKAWQIIVFVLVWTVVSVLAGGAVGYRQGIEACVGVLSGDPKR